VSTRSTRAGHGEAWAVTVPAEMYPAAPHGMASAMSASAEVNGGSATVASAATMHRGSTAMTSAPAVPASRLGGGKCRNRNGEEGGKRKA